MPGNKSKTRRKSIRRKKYCCYSGFKTKLNPTKAQAEYFSRACGVVRFTFNWGLEQCNRQNEEIKNGKASKHFTARDLNKSLNKIKETEFPWMSEVNKCVRQNALIDVEKATINHRKNPHHFKEPKFKKKYSSRDSFRMDNSAFRVSGSRIWIPCLGWVKMHEQMRFRSAEPVYATVSREADGWYVGIQVKLYDHKHLSKAKNQGRVGVDLGITNFATLSNGIVFKAPKPLEKKNNKLKWLQHKFARTEKTSRNHVKLRARIARLHQRISRIRLDFIHKVTAYIAANHSEICIEDLNVKGMMKNHHLARAISDMGWYEFRRQLEYKVSLRGGRLVIADRTYPSSKMCCFCGMKNKDVKLGDTEWDCPCCGEHIPDRDKNAAINLRNFIDRFDKRNNLLGSCSGKSGSAADSLSGNTCPSESYPDDSPAGDDPSRLTADVKQRKRNAPDAVNEGPVKGGNSKGFPYADPVPEIGVANGILCPEVFAQRIVSKQTDVQVCSEAQ